jgi:phospholipase/carboxylesterase
VRRVTRREFAALGCGALGWLAFGGCAEIAGARQDTPRRLSARPKKGTKTTARGTSRLELDRARDGILQMPEKTDGPLPLLVLLHGAGGSAERQMGRMGAEAQAAGLVVMAPDSRGGTWDAIVGPDFGADVEFIDRALKRVFEQVDVDPARTTLGGFSDGASYALSLGLANGSLFPRILAFSPGFMTGGEVQGKPSIFISHGTADRVLPIDRCSRILVPQLRKFGYQITYREFEGGHMVPPEITREGMQWAATK